MSGTSISPHSSAPSPGRSPKPRLRGSVLGLRDFRMLWVAQSVSAIGDQVFPIAATIAVLDAGGSAGAVGLVLGARWLAVVVFALVGGVWADRLPRRLVMIGADCLRALVLAALAISPALPSVWVLAALVFLVGAGEAFFRPAETALRPTLVPAHRLPSANGLMSISVGSAAVVGPGIGAALIVATGSIRVAFAINAIAFALSLLALCWLREPDRERRTRATSFLTEIGEGLAEVRRQPWLLGTVVAAAALMMLVIAPMEVLLPVIGRREFGSDTVYATSMGLFAFGGVLGALIAMRVRPRHPGLVCWLVALLVIPAVLSLLFPVSTVLIMGAYFLAGLSWSPFDVYWATAIQREVPPDKLARVSSVDWMASLSLMPLGLAVTGPLSELIGERAVLIGSCVAMVIIVACVLRVPGVFDLRNPPRPGV